MINDINFVPITLQMAVFLTGGVLLFITFLIMQVRRSKIALQDILMWFVLGLISLILIWVPHVLGILQQISGIVETPNFILLLVVGVVVFITAYQSIQLVKQRQRIQELEQDIAILKSEDKFSRRK